MIKSITYYYDEESKTEIRFQPVQHIPGYSHKVLLIRDKRLIATDWMGEEYRPSIKNATYYFEKHCTQEGK